MSTKSKIDLDESNSVLSIHLESMKPFQRFEGSYTYENLPLQFKILFENICEMHQFLTSDSQKVSIERDQICLRGDVLGKEKKFILKLNPAQLTAQELLKKQISELEQKIEEFAGNMEHIQILLVQKDQILLEKEKEIIRLNQLIKSKDSDHRKALGIIRRQIENQNQEIEEQKCKEEKIISNEDSFPPRKTNAKVKKIKELQEYGKKVILKMDETAKYYRKFKIVGNQIQKLHGPTYQIYTAQALPREGKVYFDVRIVQIKNNNIVVGVITDKNRDEQFSFKKMNSLCYNGYDGSICEQDKQKYVPTKPRQNQKIRTVLDFDKMIIKWMIVIAENNKMEIGQVAIPSTMIKQPLYPYIELYWEGNKVKINY